MAVVPGARLTVRPGRPLAGTFAPPGDKSITHRAYLLGLLARGETVVENPNPGADCEATLTCARTLGARVTWQGGAVAIEGCDMQLREPDRVLECGNSGTTLRLLAGPLAAHDFFSVLSGDASLRRRPVGRVVEPLRRMGAQLWARDGDRLPPLAIRGTGLRPIEWTLTIASAQVATCVLLAGLFTSGRTQVELPGPARDHTERILRTFGIPVVVTGRHRDPPGDRGRTIAVEGPAKPKGVRLSIPGDFSAAAFFLAGAAAMPGAVVTARDVNLNPTRAGLLAVLERMGASVERSRLRDESGETVGDVTVTGPRHLEACDIEPAEVVTLIDEVPAWVVAASAARGTSRIRGAGELRVKESDRLALLAANLGRLGVAAEEAADGLAVTGGPVRGGVVDADDDHRIAMAFAVLGTRASGAVTLDGAGCIVTSYPGFGETFTALGGDIEDAETVQVP
jgi:3-phosphoshikimate 1-carboxyvinyltransferase